MTVGKLGVFKIMDRVVSIGTGRKGQVIDMRGEDTAKVRWEDGDVFYIKFCHLAHEDRFFGGESSNKPRGLTSCISL